MNWKLILYLSLYGMVMAIATISWVSSTIEPFLWLIIFIGTAHLIAKKCAENYFLHGFLVSMVNSIWMTGAHVIFFDQYMASHPEMASMNESLPASVSPRIWMVIMGPLFGACFGLILGLFSWVASRIVKKKNA